jgi:cobalt-precorrin-5B (C1)-methyltransferase
LLDFLSEPYFYSTKTKSDIEINGTPIYGEKGVEGISDFCIKENVRLIFNAAHPFAVELHQNIFEVAKKLSIVTIRFERFFPDVTDIMSLRSFSTFEEIVEELKASMYKRILCLTGVQTIPHFVDLFNDRDCYFRILDTAHSRQLAKKNNLNDKFLLPGNPGESVDDLVRLIRKTNTEIILSKESGESGFFRTKVDASHKLNIPLWIVRRPSLPHFPYKVTSTKELLQTFYLLRKRLMQDKQNLRQGFTTGTCVTAAAKACLIALVQKKFPDHVSVAIPDGTTTRFLIFPEKISQSKASCVIIKDAGDDPDVTHSKEIGCELKFTDKPGIHFIKGKGIGVVTLPGLQLDIGEPAINPVPRQMITSVLEELCRYYEIEPGIEVKPFVPEGEQLAKQTFNPRVGVIGGISIIGTSGKVIPYSHEAFLSTIKHQVSVAKESEISEIVLTSGKRSENILKPLFKHLPDTAFIHFGNSIGNSLQLVSKKGIQKITLGVMLGKAIKFAEGHLDTHSKNSSFNPEFASWLAKSGKYPFETVRKIKNLKLANAIKDVIPFSQTEPFYQKIAKLCYQQSKTIVKEKAELSFFLIAENGDVIGVS